MRKIVVGNNPLRGKLHHSEAQNEFERYGENQPENADPKQLSPRGGFDPPDARTLLLEPLVGDFRARQISVFIGAAIIFAITLIFIDAVNGLGHNDHHPNGQRARQDIHPITG